MVDMDFSKYVELVEDRVRDKRFGDGPGDGALDEHPLRPKEIAFTEVILEILEDLGQLPSLEVAFFEKRQGRAMARSHAYGFADMDGRVDLVTTIHSEEGQEYGSIQKVLVDGAVREALNVFRAAGNAIHEGMEPSSPAYDMMDTMHGVHSKVSIIRVIVLARGIVKNPPVVQQPPNLPAVQVDIWDLERLYRADSSGLTYEPVTIDLEEHLGKPLPCLNAGFTRDDHRCFLTVLPGDLLFDLYRIYGARLLELNVRSFLQARGKVNRGIRDTLLNDPGHFLAFNNGISITAEDVQLVETSGGPAMRTVRGMQVVNGGQTVASIHRARGRDGVDLSSVKVQAKITVVAAEHLEDLVPSISRFSNTQNKVNETDFSANHPYHVRIQQLSEQIWVPGETSRWFYERARGQWEVARAREGTTPAKRRVFDGKMPKSQRIDKTLLAKTLNSWDELPHVVSLGGQKSFVHFMDRLTHHGSQWEPDADYYRELVAKVIIYKRAEAIARKHKFSAYRANAVCYTVALLSYRTSGRIDLGMIWTKQCATETLEETLRSWMPFVHQEIMTSAGDRNVTEWCKKKDCWTHVQGLRLGFPSGFEEELASGLPLPNVGAFKGVGDEGKNSLTPIEIERQATVMRYSADEWLSIVRNAQETGEFSKLELDIASTIVTYAVGGWRKIPSPKQTKRLMRMIDEWKAGDDDESRR